MFEKKFKPAHHGCDNGVVTTRCTPCDENSSIPTRYDWASTLQLLW